VRVRQPIFLRVNEASWEIFGKIADGGWESSPSLKSRLIGQLADIRASQINRRTIGNFNVLHHSATGVSLLSRLSGTELINQLLLQDERSYNEPISSKYLHAVVAVSYWKEVLCWGSCTISCWIESLKGICLSGFFVLRLLGRCSQIISFVLRAPLKIYCAAQSRACDAHRTVVRLRFSTRPWPARYDF